MNEVFKKFDIVTKKYYMSISLISIIGILLILTYCWFLFFSYDSISADSDIGRIREKQLRSLEITKHIEDNVRRSQDYNRQAVESAITTRQAVNSSQRINQQATSLASEARERIKASEDAVNGARSYLEANQRILQKLRKERESEGQKEKPSDRTP